MANNKERTEEQKKKRSQLQVEEANVDWSKRFIDPVIRMKWNAAIRVKPANSSKGENTGMRYYPNGQTEKFIVGQNHLHSEQE